MEEEPLHLQPHERGETEPGATGDGLRAGAPGQGASVESGLDINYLLAQYGHAMARVGQLEGRISVLLQQADSQASANVSELEKCRLLIGELNEKLASKDDSIGSLNSYIASLTKEMKEAKGRDDGRGPIGSRGRSRSHRKKWWEFWRKHHHRR